MNTKMYLAKNRNMKKSTKILLIIYIIFLIPSIVLGGSIFQGIKPAENGFIFDFDVKGIIALVLMGISIILGFILYFKFLVSLTVDKMLFFSILPLIIFYGVSVFLLAELNYLDNDTANSLKTILNISSESLYNTILWTVLVSIVFIVIIFFTFIFACRPLNKVEHIISRLGDGKVKQDRLTIGGGKQFQVIEHGLNKINNNYKEKDNSLKKVNLETQKFIPKQFFKFLGKNNITELELGNQITKKACTMSVKLEGIKDNNMLSLEESFQMLNSYLNVIAPIVRKFGGFVDKYLGSGIIAVFNKSENAINCAQVLVRAIEVKNRQNKTLPNVQQRISIISGDVIFGVVGEEERKIPTIVSDITSDLEKLDEICKLMGMKVIFTKMVLDDLPLNYRINYRFIGSINISENREIMLYENLDVYPRDIFLPLKRTKKIFEKGVIDYNNQNYNECLDIFTSILRIVPNDKASYIYFNKSKEKIDRL